MNSPLPSEGPSGLGEVEPAAPPTPLAPPTRPGMLGRGRSKPAWPIGIGVVAVVFGAGGMLKALQTPFASMSAGITSSSGGIFDPTDDTAPVFWTLAAVQFLTAALLLTGGILLLCRPGRARMNLLVWAVVKVLISVPTVWLSYEFGEGWTSYTPFGWRSSAESNPVLAAIQAAWLLALPVFTLVWFSRRSVREYLKLARTRSQNRVS